MSQLLDALIQARKQQALNYSTYLAKIIELTKQVSKPGTQALYPATITTDALRALYDTLKQCAETAVREEPVEYAGVPPGDATVRLAVAVDQAIRNVKKADWRGNHFKEREVRSAIKGVLNDDHIVNTIFDIVKKQRDY